MINGVSPWRISASASARSSVVSMSSTVIPFLPRHKKVARSRLGIVCNPARGYSAEPLRVFHKRSFVRRAWNRRNIVRGVDRLPRRKQPARTIEFLPRMTAMRYSHDAHREFGHARDGNRAVAFCFADGRGCASFDRHRIDGGPAGGVPARPRARPSGRALRCFNWPSLIREFRSRAAGSLQRAVRVSVRHCGVP